MPNRCEECGYDWDMPPLDQLRVIGEFPNRTERLVKDVGERAYARPQPNVWAPSEYVWHMVDAFRMFAEWLNMTRVEDHPTHAPSPADALAELRTYGDKPLSTGLWALRPAVALFLQEAVIADRRRLVTYKGWRDVTAGEVIGFAAHEVVHHTFDLERMLGVASTPRASAG